MVLAAIFCCKTSTRCIVFIVMHIRMIEACIKANSFAVKNVITIFNFKVRSPFTQHILYAIYFKVYLHSICKWEAGSSVCVWGGGGKHTSKLKIVINICFNL